MKIKNIFLELVAKQNNLFDGLSNSSEEFESKK